mgnify:CR=1 FL=1
MQLKKNHTIKYQDLKFSKVQLILNLIVFEKDD